MLKIRNLEIGNNEPKICVPVVENNMEHIIDECKKIEASNGDIVELRIDYTDFCLDTNEINKNLKIIRKLTTKPIIFTFRSKKEGGEKEISINEYKAILLSAIDSGCVDFVDVELMTGDEFAREIVDYAHKNGVYVIMSNHDFNKTPDRNDIENRLSQMNLLGADIVKIAAMPCEISDVMKMLDATRRFKKQNPDVLTVSMSMGNLGVISRMAGEIFGSCITFAQIGKASAPGQMEVNDLKNVLEIIHNYYL